MQRLSPKTDMATVLKKVRVGTTRACVFWTFGRPAAGCAHPVHFCSGHGRQAGVVQVIIDQLTYGPMNNLINMAFFTLLVESAPPPPVATERSHRCSNPHQFGQRS